jgi:hypothetical protein
MGKGLIVRWKNNEHYRERVFLDTDLIADEDQEWALGAMDLNSLTESHKKFLFKYLSKDNIENNNYVIEIKEPYVDKDRGIILTRLKTLNRMNISGLELIRELSQYERLYAQRMDEVTALRAEKRVKKLVKEEIEKQEAAPQKTLIKKDPWWKVW